ncbi:MAG: type I methionyl aminopeptidase [Candidatus Gracilibacteria bacterium]|nr:type I methionyl aminopeptidase [Candidatus Gracilibacteria bacterium]
MIVKNNKEIEQLRKNGKIHKIIFEEIKKIIKPGVSAIDIDILCSNLCKKHAVLPGFKGVYNFPANICISINDVVVHGIPKKNMIFKEGDVVKFDFGVKDKNMGLNTDAAFTVIIGDENKYPKIKKLLDTTKEALYKGIEQCKIGNKIGDISNAIQKHVESEGFFIVKDLTGHGLGFTLHEKPYIYNYGKPNTGEKIKKGMLLAIEPITGFSSGRIYEKGGFEIYISDGSYGCQFEHTILVTDNEPEIIV